MASKDLKDSTGKGSSKDAAAESLFLETDGGLTTPIFLLLVAGLLFFAKLFFWGWMCLAICFVVLLLQAVTNQLLPDGEKNEIKFNIMTADDVLKEMKHWRTVVAAAKKKDDDEYEYGGSAYDDGDEKNSKKSAGEKKTSGPVPTIAAASDADDSLKRFRMVMVTGLSALAKKFDKQRRYHQMEEENLALRCQEAAYMGLEYFGGKDVRVCSACISLLALTAKTEEVRERTQLQADCYGLDIPIQSLQTALLLAQDVTDAKEEQAAAELQRIGCLLLGALADKNASMARLVVQEGGLDLILASSSWFRHHEGVSNWALWAIFQLCYEHPLNKLELVRAGGLRVVCQIMENLAGGSLEVARHGMAILFDILQQQQIQQPSDQQHKDIPLDSSYTAAVQTLQLQAPQIRIACMAAGLHAATVKAMQGHCHTMDLMLMGQEILVGTGYEGEVPQYEPMED